MGVITTHVKTTKHATEGNYSSYGGHRSLVFESPEFPVEFGTNRQFSIRSENTSPWIRLQCERVYVIRLNRHHTARCRDYGRIEQIVMEWQFLQLHIVMLILALVIHTVHHTHPVCGIQEHSRTVNNEDWYSSGKHPIT